MWRIDRLSRSIASLALLLDDLRGWRVEFRSIMDQVDTTTAAGQAVYGVIGVMAQLERDLTSERTRAGIKAARRRGARVGRLPKISPDRLDYVSNRINAGEECCAVIAAQLGVALSTLHHAMNFYR